MQIVGLDHFQLGMPAGEEASARSFYGELLGLIEVPKPPELASRGGCWFEDRGVYVHLGVQGDFQPSRKGHPALLVADLEAARKELEAAGVEVTPDNALPHVRRFYAHDPFGNRIEFIQDGDGLSQRG